MEPRIATRAWDWLGTEITPGSRVIWNSYSGWGIGIVTDVYRPDYRLAQAIDVQWERKRHRNYSRKGGSGISPRNLTVLPIPENFADVADDD